MRLAGKVALITGAGGGLGRAQAIRFAAEGARLVLTDIDPAADSVAESVADSSGETAPAPGRAGASLAETVEAVGGHDTLVLARSADVRRLSDLEQIVELALAEFGALDIVCANAAVLAFGRTWELSPHDWQRVLDVNLTGTWNTVRASVPALLARGSGSIIFTCSLSARKATPNMAPYVASKSGMLGLMRTLAAELGPSGIRVNAILPGLVATPMVLAEDYLREALPNLVNPTAADLSAAFEQRNLLHSGLLDPQDVAEAAAWLGSDAARSITGVELPVDAGASIR